MRHRFEDVFNMNILNWKINLKINFITTSSTRMVEFSSKIASFFRLKFEHANYISNPKYFIYLSWTLISSGFNFFAEIMGGNYIFCCSSRISFNSIRYLKCLFNYTLSVTNSSFIALCQSKGVYMIKIKEKVVNPNTNLFRRLF